MKHTRRTDAWRNPLAFRHGVKQGGFDLVICCNYLFRPRLDELFGLVAAGGALVCETFARGNARYGRPASPKFLLGPGELATAAARNGFVVIAFEHGFTGAPRPAMVQRICAARAPVSAVRFMLDVPDASRRSG